MPTEFINAVASNQEREAIEQLNVRVGLSELPLHGNDSMLSSPNQGLFGVFDGAGNDAEAGPTARAVNSCFATFDQLSNMNRVDSEEEAIDTMRAAFTYARSQQEHGPGGATTAAVVKLFSLNGKPHLVAGNAGDSRIMLWRKGRITDITEEQCLDEPGKRNTIINWIGVQQNRRQAEDEIRVVRLRKGDKVVVCTDGITGDEDAQRLVPAEFADALRRDDPEEAALRLVQLSLKNDDKSVIVLSFGKTKEKEPAPEPEEKAAVSEKIKEKTAKAAAFIAGLGIAQKVRGFKLAGVAEKARSATKAAGAKIKNGSLNAAAWTAVKKDNFTAAAKSKETYANIPNRVAKSFTSAKDSLQKLYISAGYKLAERRENRPELTDEQKRRRRMIIGGVMGAAIVAATAYKVWHGIDSSGGGSGSLLDTLPGDPPEDTDKDKKDKKDRSDVPDGKDRNNPPETERVPRNLTLDEPGSSIWSTIDETAEQRGVKLTDAQTYDLVEKTLQHNNLTWEEARHLPVDYQFGIPEEVRHELEKSKN